VNRPTRARLWPLLALAVALAPFGASADPPSPELPIPLPVFPELRFPESTTYFLIGVRYPSLNQAVSLSEAEIDFTHWLVRRPGWSPLIEGLVTAGADVLLHNLPGGGLWAYEQGKSAVYASAGIPASVVVFPVPLTSGFTFAPFGPDKYPVLWDAFQRSRALVRLHEAGWEAQRDVLNRVERDAFFAHRPGYQNIAPAALNGIATWGELNACLDHPEDHGDCVRWSYDLHRPQQSILVLPGGQARYSDGLTQEERVELVRQRNLSLLLLLDPNLLGFGGFEARNPLDGQRLRGTATFRPVMTSFGDMFQLRMLAQEGKWNVELLLEDGANAKSALFPGVGAAVYRLPVSVLGRTLHVTAGGELWLQPQGQDFRTASVFPGAMLRGAASYPVQPWAELSLEALVKSPGWVLGEPDLGASFRIGGGLTLLLP